MATDICARDAASCTALKSGVSLQCLTPKALLAPSLHKLLHYQRIHDAALAFSSVVSHGHVRIHSLGGANLASEVLICHIAIYKAWCLEHDAMPQVLHVKHVQSSNWGNVRVMLQRKLTQALL